MSRYDEEAKYDRPKRRTRPRTKDRPAYDDAVTGFVITRDRGRYTCWVGESDRVVTAMKARQLGRKGVIVGDLVKLDGDATGDEGTLARIVEVLPRKTLLRRSADDDDPIERPLVANADQLVIVVAVANPVESVATQRDGDLSELAEQLRDRTSVMVGHSGVGKSTLVNALVPGTNRAIGVVNDNTGRGRHTSVSALLLRLPDGGWIVDTPGIRSFGLAQFQPDQLINAIGDQADETRDSPRGCTHTESEPNCALDVAVAEGRVDAERVASFRRLLASREGRDLETT